MAGPPSRGAGPPADRLAHVFLLQLSRAVQRTSMYPPGHPASSVGFAPFVDATRRLLAHGAISLAVGRTRLLVATGNQPPTEHESPWLAARLFDREVATLAIQRDFDAAEALVLVAWLAQHSREADVEMPELSTVHLARFDGSHMRFREQHGQRGEPGAATTTTDAWRALVAPLLSIYGDPDHPDAAMDPARLAELIRQTLLSREGTGISELSTHLVDMHERATQASPDARGQLLDQLANLVAALHPELKGSLLTVSTEDDPRKVQAVEDLLERLPASVVEDIISSLRISQDPVPPSFSRFLKTLVRLSVMDPNVGEAMERRFGLAGLPVSLFEDSAPSEEDTESTEADDDEEGPDPVPEDYRRQLEHLSSPTLQPAQPPAEMTRGMAPEAIDQHAARIALLEARHATESADVAVCLHSLRLAAPRQLARDEMSALAESADLLLRLTSDSETRVEIDELRSFFAARKTVDAAIAAIAAAPDSPSFGLLLAAGGAPAVRVALDWLAAVRDADAYARVASALARVDSEVFRTVILPALESGMRLAEIFVSLLDEIEPARAIELALHLMDHGHPEIRRRVAVWLLASQLTVAKRRLVLRRALDDDDDGMVQIAIDAASQDSHQSAQEALLEFIAHRAPAKRLPLLRTALAAIDVNRPEIAELLGLILRGRRYIWSGHARRLSAAIASALKGSDVPAARARSRAWWRSPSGLLSLLTGTWGDGQ